MEYLGDLAGVIMGSWLELKFLNTGEWLYPEHAIILELETIETLLNVSGVHSRPQNGMLYPGILLLVFLSERMLHYLCCWTWVKFLTIEDKREHDLESVFCLQNKYKVFLLESS